MTIAVSWAVIPADHSMQIAVAISGVCTSLLLPAMLYLDYRGRYAESSAEGRVRETADALIDRVRDVLPGRDSSTRASSSCSYDRQWRGNGIASPAVEPAQSEWVERAEQSERDI